jgi:hypothetical protein
VTARTCYACRTGYRSWAEHANTDKHRRATTSVRSTGARGSAAYRPPAVLPRSVSDYEDWLEEKALEAAVIVPSIDTLPPFEIGEPPPDRAPAVRGHKPPPCPRCGAQQKTPAGAAWHAVNNPQCEKWAPARRRLAN